MPDNDETHQMDDSTTESNLDPLGILGWLIARKYKVKKYLGGGGFGEVYEGYNENLPEQRLVIKFFKRVQAREKFDKEAKILCLLDHPNICRVIDYLPEEGAVVVAFIDGHDGGVILRESGALPEQLFLKVARSITDAIAYAHTKKIAHRDIKPGNIIVDKAENVFLIDFGIAKEMGTDATKTAYTALTPMIAAPERQVGQKDYNPFLSDIYETGITLFNLATNSLPYRNPTNPNAAEWGGVAARRLSPELTRILRKATHPEPNKRFKSAREMADELKNLSVAFGSGGKRSRLPVYLGLLAVLIVAGFFGRGYLIDFWNRMFTSEPKIAQTPDNPSVTQPDQQEEITTEATTPEDQKPPDQGVNQSEQTAKEPVRETITPVKKDEKPPPPPPAKAEEKPIVQEPPPEQKPTPKQETPPPPVSKVLVAVIPSDSASLTVGGTPRQSGSRFEIAPGKYALTAMHPDFPIYRQTLEATNGSVDVAVDLARQSIATDTVDLQVALIPPNDNCILELSRNGRRQVIYNFPYLGLTQPTGEWYFEINIRPIGPAAGSEIKIDSCVMFPFVPELRETMKGRTGFLKVGDPGQSDVSIARFLIYWTEQ